EQTAELFRRIRSVLNKLTPQMFQPLMKQITEMTIDTEPRLKGVIDLVFEKAIAEPNFSVAYANMCRCLMGVRVCVCVCVCVYPCFTRVCFSVFSTITWSFKLCSLWVNREREIMCVRVCVSTCVSRPSW